MVCTCFGVPSTHGGFFLRKTKISIFCGISRPLELIVFGQIWADFATLAVADIMLKLDLKFKKPSNF
jgi:hypothetical protein